MNWTDGVSARNPTIHLPDIRFRPEGENQLCETNTRRRFAQSFVNGHSTRVIFTLTAKYIVHLCMRGTLVLDG